MYQPDPSISFLFNYTPHETTQNTVNSNKHYHNNINKLNNGNNLHTDTLFYNLSNCLRYSIYVTS